MLMIEGGLAIPRNELEIKATRSGGPGGQNVNKVSTRIEILWSVPESSLPSDVRARLQERLASRLDGRGRLRVVCATHRSQSKNRLEAEERLAAIVSAALRRRKARRPTVPTKASKARRLQDKRRRKERKQGRGAPRADD